MSLEKCVWRNTQVVEGTGLENQQVGNGARVRISIPPPYKNFYLSRDGAGVARWAHNPEVVGSNPSPATKWFVSVVVYHVCLSRRRSRVQIPYEPPLWLHSSVGRAED